MRLVTRKIAKQGVAEVAMVSCLFTGHNHKFSRSFLPLYTALTSCNIRVIICYIRQLKSCTKNIFSQCTKPQNTLWKNNSCRSFMENLLSIWEIIYAYFYKKKIICSIFNITNNYFITLADLNNKLLALHQLIETVSYLWLKL